MNENDVVKDSTAAEQKALKKDNNKKKHKDDKPRTKRTRRQFREAQQAQAQPPGQVQEPQNVTPDTDKGDGELHRADSTTSLSPSAIIEMFHLQDDEHSRVTQEVATARYLVENEVSGDFYQVRTRQRKLHASLPEHVRHRRSLIRAQQKLRAVPTTTESWRWWAILHRDAEKAVVVMVLGIVAGMCWMDALNLRSGTPTSGADRFLCAYSAGANRSRQNLFILFNGVVIGLLRRLSQMDPRQEYRALGDGAVAELTSHRLLQVATALISAALIVLLVESPYALRLSRAQQADATWCDDVAPLTDLFHRGILTLQVCSVLNTTLVTAAWLLVALLCSATMSSTVTNRDRIVELQESLSSHEKRIDELQGTHLDSTSTEDLKSLIQLHQRAIERTEGVLVAKLQAQHCPTAAS